MPKRTDEDCFCCASLVPGCCGDIRLFHEYGRGLVPCGGGIVSVEVLQSGSIAVGFSDLFDSNGYGGSVYDQYRFALTFSCSTSLSYNLEIEVFKNGSPVSDPTYEGSVARKTHTLADTCFGEPHITETELDYADAGVSTNARTTYLAECQGGVAYTSADPIVVTDITE